MAGPVSVKIKETMSMEELATLVNKGWNEEKYGKASLVEFRDKAYIGFTGSNWFTILAYPARKKVVIQSFPENAQIVMTKEGQKEMKQVNREIVPHIAEGFRELLGTRLR